MNTAAEPQRATRENGVLRQAGPGHRLGPRDSQRMSRVEVEATGVARGHTLPTRGRPNGACNTDLGADPSKAIWEERYALTSLTITLESPWPFTFVREEVPLHEVIRAEWRSNSTRLSLLATASICYSDPECGAVAFAVIFT